MRRSAGFFEAYRDFASAFGTVWLLVIVLAILTGGRIGRWSALILPVQIVVSLGFAALRGWKRRAANRAKAHEEISGPRYLPI